ncbi:BLUF domain-containing protein [Brevundimonas sp. TWP2-3-4b2]|uniref:BLUF domain-containing protein n=1 Tax=Brevundimonas sp. TWP2-3-4b2 TaxID=2804595 RepID=UPI003CFB67DA
MEKNLIRMVYRSDSCISHDDVSGLDAIFKTSLRNNKRDGLTGALALPDGKFVQVIEGDRHNIGLLMMRIRADSRHEDVTVLGEWEVQTRLFRGWAMARPDPTPLSEQSFRIVTENGSGAQVTGILLDLMSKAEHRYVALEVY